MKCCYKCGGFIKFIRRSGGKWMPLNIDGSQHICVKPLPKDSEYTGNPRNRPLMIVGKTITGPDFYVTECTCLPWEDCTCGKCRNYKPKSEYSDLINLILAETEKMTPPKNDSSVFGHRT